MVAIFINFALAHSESLSIIDLIIFIIKGTFNGNFTLYFLACLLHEGYPSYNEHKQYFSYLHIYLHII